ncbi:MAG: hypothetical protein JXQ72_16225 [Anaerolineae bacterium]|nr:hypothetical protein [Anaerolineae bacterium]
MAKRAPVLWPLVLMVGGVVLLLNNFLLIDLDLAAYWPVLLVLAGAQIVLRGDIAPSWQAHTFGITRGSVQSASLEIESGELDVQVRALRKTGRLIAGQYTARSRPSLNVRNNHATLRMQRGQTWWLSMADWDVSLARDLPWEVLVSSYLGRLEVDLQEVQVERAYIASGMGSVDVICPAQATGTIFARSTFGDVRLSIPANSRAIITVSQSAPGRVKVDPDRFEEIEPGTYITLNAGAMDENALELDIVAKTVFGAVHIN